MKTLIISLPKGDYEITEETYIDFEPATEEEEILQNVRTICKTPKNSVPLDREFGVDVDFLDTPTPSAMAQIQREIITAIRKYEPRAKIDRVEFVNDENGKLSVEVSVSLDYD